MKKIIEIIKKKWLRDTFLTALLIAIIFAIYFGANYGIKKLNLSDIDLTTDKIYSISESTESKISAIEEKVTIQLINLSNIISVQFNEFAYSLSYIIGQELSKYPSGK